MKAWIWIVFALIILLAVVFFVSESGNLNLGNSENKDNANNNDAAITSNASIDKINLSNNPSSNGISSNSGSSGGGGSGGGSASTEDKKDIPRDINTAECGFYYSEYGVCSGTCPLGECASEGRSCYCKKQ